jgi:hypothetical protein
MGPNSPEVTFPQICQAGYGLYFVSPIESGYNKSGEKKLQNSNLMRSIPIALAVLTFGMPAQAGMPQK